MQKNLTYQVLSHPALTPTDMIHFQDMCKMISPSSSYLQHSFARIYRNCYIQDSFEGQTGVLFLFFLFQQGFRNGAEIGRLIFNKVTL